MVPHGVIMEYSVKKYIALRNSHIESSSMRNETFSLLTSKKSVYSCHVTYACQSKSTLYICLNVKELLARSWREI